MDDSSFEDLISDEISNLPKSSREKYFHVYYKPYRVVCERDGRRDDLGLIVLGKHDAQLLIYDDTEEEFGIAASSESGLIRAWKLFGDLKFALDAM